MAKRVPHHNDGGGKTVTNKLLLSRTLGRDVLLTVLSVLFLMGGTLEGGYPESS